jgi:phosphogluconate dehydratase
MATLQPTAPLHPVIGSITERIIARSADSRAAYLERISTAASQTASRTRLSCSNLAHVYAGVEGSDRAELRSMRWANLAIVSAYNDMLSAHQPLERFPALIKQAAREAGAVAQFAGGVPAMCDGVTQGRPGMELSLFSRDVIALSTAIALSHDAFDAALCLGVCDKIVPGLLIAALTFGHLPTIFVPAGPMPSGLPNAEKSRIRRAYTEGKVGRDALLQAESASYHSPGTCTFYGTANSNQMLMEAMGLHLPGSAFVPPATALRDRLTMAAAKRAAVTTALGGDYIPVGRIVDERCVVNAIAALLATGGSTNHTIHLVAVAAAAGIQINWDDFDELSAVVPLLARVYPNGEADVNHFQAAGGTQLVIRELLTAGLMHGDTLTVMGPGLARYTEEPVLADGALTWRPGTDRSLDLDVLRPVAAPFAADGGIRVLRGNLGRAVLKVSAMKPEHFVIEAPALVFDSQDAVANAFKAGQLERDFVAVIRGQGPRANGMPELHQLTPTLGSLLARGFRVALVTDGRMSGASGSVPAALHVTPECAANGPLTRVRDGDLIRVDANARSLSVLVPQAEFASRTPVFPPTNPVFGVGRELFAGLRASVGDAESGARSLSGVI